MQRQRLFTTHVRFETDTHRSSVWRSPSYHVCNLFVYLLIYLFIYLFIYLLFIYFVCFFIYCFVYFFFIYLIHAFIWCDWISEKEKKKKKINKYEKTDGLTGEMTAGDNMFESKRIGKDKKRTLKNWTLRTFVAEPK